MWLLFPLLLLTAPAVQWSSSGELPSPWKPSSFKHTRNKNQTRVYPFETQRKLFSKWESRLMIFPRGVINYSRFKVMVGAGTFAIDCKNSSFFCRLYSRIWLQSKKMEVWLMWPKWQRDYWSQRRPSPALDQPSRGLAGSEQTWLFPSLLFSYVCYAGCLHKWAPSLQ